MQISFAHIAKEDQKKNNFDSICIGFEKLNIFSKKLQTTWN